MLREENVAEINCSERNLATLVNFSSRDNFLSNFSGHLIPATFNFFEKKSFLSHFLLKDFSFLVM